jgi:Ca2+-binding RTX toxin-like protein
VDRPRAGVAGGRTRFLAGLVAISALAALVAIPVGPALAKRIVGTSGADKIAGTKRADRINGRGGSDRINGRQSGDRLKGARGKDRLKGAQGKDRLSAGKGADHLNGVDGKKDRVVNGGPGKDVCKVDRADLPVLKNCDTARIKNGGRGGGLRVTSASGLTCGSSGLPTCHFQAEGDGADSPAGSVSGGGGVTLAAGAGVVVTGDSWTAHALYRCSADGYLKVTIGSESVRVPITCTA